MNLYYKYISAAAAVLLAAWFSAGNSYAMGASTPEGPDAASGVHYCTECGMRVDEAGLFASRISFRDEKTRWFCDLGDMMLHYDGLKDKGAVSVIHVKDYASGEWTDGAKASYLTGSSVRTPMRYGILAFADRKDADAFMKSSGGAKVLSFEEAIASGAFRE